MASLTLTGDTSGQVTLAAPAVAGTTTLTLPATTGTVLNDATVGVCRAWVNFNGTTGTIRASFNVTSITKNGTGDYTVNFTTAMSDANYAANVTTQTGGIVSATTYDSGTARTTTALRVCALTTAGSFVDSAQMGVAVFR